MKLQSLVEASSSDNVYSKVVYVSKQQLEAALQQIRRDLTATDDKAILDFHNVINNQKLLDYICSSMIDDGVALHDPVEFWSNDGWSDWRHYV